MSARGSLPCCAMNKLCKIFSRVVRQFSGLGNIELDRVVCPGCVISQRAAGTSSVTPSPPHCFHVRSVRRTAQRNASSPSLLSSSSSSAAAANCASEQWSVSNSHNLLSGCTYIITLEHSIVAYYNNSTHQGQPSNGITLSTARPFVKISAKQIYHQ